MNNIKELPIGVFDSGMGGITVLSSLLNELPNERFIYFGDSKNAPYGVKEVDHVRELTIKACDFFISLGVKAIVIACNTATSAAIKDLRKKYTIPIIGVEPALKPAVEYSDSGVIAVMATPMTLQENKFEKLMNKYMDKNTIVKVPCPEIVQLVEDGHIDDDLIINSIDHCFRHVNKELLESIVLGCTHFVFLHNVMKVLFSDSVKIFDGNSGTAKQTKRLLKKDNILLDEPLPYLDRVSIINSKSEELVEQSWKLLGLLGNSI